MTTSSVSTASSLSLATLHSHRLLIILLLYHPHRTYLYRHCLKYHCFLQNQRKRSPKVSLTPRCRILTNNGRKNRTTTAKTSKTFSRHCERGLATLIKRMSGFVLFWTVGIGGGWNDYYILVLHLGSLICKPREDTVKNFNCVHLLIYFTGSLKNIL